MIKGFFGAVLVAVMLSSTSSLFAQQPRVSPPDTISGLLQGTNATGPRVIIYYSRPFTKAPNGTEMRKIWGGLIPYGKVWRMGANEATHLITALPIEIGGTAVPAGAYTLWALPQADGSAKLIVNKQIGIWGEAYDEKSDLARVDLVKAALEKSVDQFTMALDPNPAGGFMLKMSWENMQYSVPVTVKK